MVPNWQATETMTADDAKRPLTFTPASSQEISAIFKKQRVVSNNIWEHFELLLGYHFFVVIVKIP
jgi:hypothetical protein